jgi:hypothetical protein
MRFERIDDGLEDASGEFPSRLLEVAFELCEGRRGDAAATKLGDKFAQSTPALIEDFVEGRSDRFVVERSQG